MFYKPAYLQKNIHRRLLSIQVFSADGHYGLIVSLRMNAIVSCDKFKPIRIGTNLAVNHKLIVNKGTAQAGFYALRQLREMSLSENEVTSFAYSFLVAPPMLMSHMVENNLIAKIY